MAVNTQIKAGAVHAGLTEGCNHCQRCLTSLEAGSEYLQQDEDTKKTGSWCQTAGGRGTGDGLTLFEVTGRWKCEKNHTGLVKKRNII